MLIQFLYSSEGTKGPGGLYIVNCSSIASLPNITFQFPGNKLSLDAKHYIIQIETECVSGFHGMDFGEDQPKWILGDIFWGQYYSVYSMVPKNESVTFYTAK